VSRNLTGTSIKRGVHLKSKRGRDLPEGTSPNRSLHDQREAADLGGIKLLRRSQWFLETGIDRGIGPRAHRP